MKPVLDTSALGQLFGAGHTFNKFSDQPVSEQTIRELYEQLEQIAMQHE